MSILKPYHGTPVSFRQREKCTEQMDPDVFSLFDWFLYPLVIDEMTNTLMKFLEMLVNFFWNPEWCIWIRLALLQEPKGWPSFPVTSHSLTCANT